MTFYIGQRVICIYAWKKPLYEGSVPPKFMQIYTVIDITQGATRQGLVLAEVPSKNPLGWSAYRFRPLIDIDEEHELKSSINA